MLAGVTFSSGLVSVTGTGGNDLIELFDDGNSQSFTVSVNNDASMTSTFNYSDVNEVSVAAGSGNDVVQNTLSVSTTIYGQDGDDTLIGGFADDTIYGGNGDDVIHGGDGNDTITGQNDNDTITGGAGDDHLSGGYGNDTISGGDGNDLVLGQFGNDSLYGQDGNDTIRGWDGEDEIYGGAGADTIGGDDGDDLIYGGNGDDVINGDAGNDTITGQNDNDTITGGTGDDDLSGGYGNDTISGGDGNDWVRGQFGNDFLYGQDGNDTIRGWDGEDEIYGGAGADTIGGDNGDDLIYGGNGDDVINGDAGNDTITGQNDNDTITGGAGDDDLSGGYGDDTISGGDGNDRVLGQFDSDTLFGDSGNDFLHGGSDSAVDSLTGGLGVDEFGGVGSVDVVTDRAGIETYSGYTGPLTPLVEVEGDKLFVYGTSERDKFHIYARDGQDKFDLRIDHQFFATYLNSEISEIVIDAGAGNDEINNNNRSIVPMRVEGGAGEDDIYGGLGDDTLFGGADDDTIRGHDGDDFIRGGNGDDNIDGDDGDDVLSGNDGDDHIDGDSGNDTLHGGEGDDQLKGDSGNDWLGGNEGNDQLYGHSGEDTLHGHAGLDELRGGSDNDILSGGTDDENDLLWGNGGLDEFFAVRDDDVKDADTSSSETVVDPVAGQTQLTQDAAATQLHDSQFESFLDGLPAGALTQVVGNFTIVNTGAVKLAFLNDGETTRQIGSFPTSFSIIDIVNISEDIVGLEGNSDIQALGNPSFSAVPVDALEGTATLDPVYEVALVASGTNGVAVIGGVAPATVEFGTEALAVSQSAVIETTNSASVASNVSGLALGRSILNAGNTTLEVIGQLQSPGEVPDGTGVFNVQDAARLVSFALVNPVLQDLAPVSVNGPIVPSSAVPAGQFLFEKIPNQPTGVNLFFNPPACSEAECSEIGFIQVFRAVDTATGSPFIVEREVVSFPGVEGLFPSGDLTITPAFGTASRISIAGPPVLAPANTDILQRQTANGWAIDREVNRNFAFYGVNDNGTNAVPAGQNPNYYPASSGVIGVLQDLPTFAPVNGVRYEFQSFAVVRAGTLEGKVLGARAWSVSVNAGSATVLDGGALNVQNSVNGVLQPAIAAWNDQAAGILHFPNGVPDANVGPTGQVPINSSTIRP